MRQCLGAEAGVEAAAEAGAAGAGGAGPVHGGGDQVARLAVVADQQPSHEPALAVLRQPAAQPRGGGPHQLAVVARGGAEPVVGDRGLRGGELRHLAVPTLHSA